MLQFISEGPMYVCMYVFGWILSFHFQDIERKQNSDVNQGP